MRTLCGKKGINSIRSVYPKDKMVDILQWIAEYGLIEYGNKEKILN